MKTFDEIARRVPVLADIRPSGRFLMEDFFYAGGLRALMGEMKDLLHLDALTVNGATLGANLEGARVVNPEVIRPRGKALVESGGTAVLYGNLCPDGAVIKTSAATPALLQHTGPAVVFQDYNDMDARINRDQPRRRKALPARRWPSKHHRACWCICVQTRQGAPSPIWWTTLRRHAGRVELVATQHERAVLVTVDDDGPGIPPDRRESVFRPFESDSTGGTGLGLTIARDIVRAHGGDIVLEDSPLGGLRARIRLPV